MTGPEDKDGLDKAVQQTTQSLGGTIEDVGDRGAEATHAVIDAPDTVAADALESIDAARSAVDRVLARAIGILRAREAMLLVVGVAVIVSAVLWRRR
ncbi:hypothetical protein [Mycolicibacterium goodii]|uniref:DUF3618 domain-containing protein n=1 Tax=Mycolicibacterium goodii TaxID=134601 RepID=A0A0K0X544_MYCGD|nr:hypothetical protein AFA91_11865 [Mycolicibacterium goodii]